MLDTLFGEGQSGLKILFFVIVVLVLLGLAFWLLRRFGGGRLGGGATRGRQPRLAVIDQATVDGRRRLVLIRRDNVEHLLIIGGPTDVVVEQNIVRAAAALREGAPARPPAAADTLPRAVPLGEDTSWPLQPEPAPKVEPAARVEPSLRAEARPQRPSTAGEEPMPWPGERPPVEPEAPPLPPLPSPPPPPRERKPRISDPLSGLAEELSRIPGAPEPAEPSPRRMPRLQPAPPAAASVADAALKPPADQNLSEMAQRLEAALRRPGKSEDTRAAPPPKAAGEPAPESEAFTPPPPFPRPDMTLRRPLKTDDARAAPPAPPPGEPAAAPSDEAQAATPADPAKGARGKGPDAKPAPQKSFYDSLEQEMASLLNRPPSKP
jgi:flagellar biogenesis protein FliO